MRVGQKHKLTYRWARKGSRPRAAHDQRTQSTYLFGAVCPERGTGAALVLPACNTEAMQLHLDEIATKITPGLTPFSSSTKPDGMVPRPSSSQQHLAPAARARAQRPRKHLAVQAAELAVKSRLQILRRLVDHCCYPWNTLIDQPWKIMSVARRDWAVVGYSI
jgi:hypothetical protein